MMGPGLKGFDTLAIDLPSIGGGPNGWALAETR